MNSLRRFLDHFFSRVSSVPVPEPSADELIDGKAFAIRHYPLEAPIYTGDFSELRAWILENGERIADIREPVSVAMRIDTISTIRFNDALGFKHAVGALFGERKP